MIQYILLSAVSVLAGQGALRIISGGGSLKNHELLAPAVMMSLWSIFLGASIPLGIPVKASWGVIFGITGILAIVGIFSGGRDFYAWQRSKWMLFALVLPPLFLYPYIVHGVFTYAGSPAWDGWSYVANGRYLWEYPLGSDGGLRPLYQYGAHLAESRFVGTGILGLLSPLALKPGETHVTQGLFLLWSFFVTTCSVLFFALQQDWKNKYSFLYAILAICSGWLIMTVAANNYDNLLILTILPAFAACCRYGGISGRRDVLLMGLLLASLQYCYAELSSLAMFVGAVLLVGRRERAWEKMRFMGFSLGLGILLLAPYWKILVIYFQRQFGAADLINAARPGEGFILELLSEKYAFPVYWGTWLNSFEAVFPSIKGALLAGSWVAAFLALLLFFLGCRILLRKHDWAPVVVSWIFIGASLFFILVKRYDYGAYKIILMNWWLVSFVIVLGLEQCLTGIGSRYGRKPALVLFGTAMICFLGLGWGKMSLLDHIVMPKTLQQYEIIRSMVPTGAGNKIALLVDDNAANAWAVYFLRENPLAILRYRHYMAMPYTRTFMNRAEKIAATEADFVVADRGQCIGNESVRVMNADAGEYCILKVLQPEWLMLMQVENPNGREHADGDSFYWLGQGGTELYVFSAVEKPVRLRLDLILGPSLPGGVPRTLKVTSDLEQPRSYLVDRDGPLTFTIRLRAGENKIVLTPLDKPTEAVLPNGDGRPLILRLNSVSFGI